MKAEEWITQHGIQATATQLDTYAPNGKRPLEIRSVWGLCLRIDTPDGQRTLHLTRELGGGLLWSWNRDLPALFAEAHMGDTSFEQFIDGGAGDPTNPRQQYELWTGLKHLWHDVARWLDGHPASHDMWDVTRPRSLPSG